jgi:DNA-directed RNA polymerase subunit E'/Rpb7
MESQLQSPSSTVANMSNIYFETLIDKKVVVEPRYLTANNTDYILGKLKKRYEGNCLKEGHIKEDSIEIVVKGVGILEGSHFTGDITYNIRFRALVCKPVIGDLLEFEVKVINQVGPRGILGPIQITVPRELHDEMEMKAMSKVKVGDMIRVRVITTHYTPSSSNIRVVAKMDVPAAAVAGKGMGASKRGSKRGIGAESGVGESGRDFVTSDALDDDEDGGATLEGMSDGDEEEEQEEDQQDDEEEEEQEEEIELSDSEDEGGEGEDDAEATNKKPSFNIDKQMGEEEEASEIDLEEEFEDSENESDQSDHD